MPLSTAGTGRPFLPDVRHGYCRGARCRVYLRAGEPEDYLNQFPEWALKGWYDIILKVAIPLVPGTLLVLNVYSGITSAYGGYDFTACAIGFVMVVILAPLAAFVPAKVMGARRAVEED